MSIGNYVLDEQGLSHNFAVEPQMYLQQSPGTGLTTYTERLNGRLAMIGFVSVIILEILTGHSLIGFLASLS